MRIEVIEKIFARFYSLTNFFIAFLYRKQRHSLEGAVHFIFFYSRGHPYDKGYDLSKVAEDIYSNLSKYFATITGHNKQSLKTLEGSEKYCNEYPEELISNPNANSFGYFNFKPFIIKDQLGKIPDGDVFVYHDGNFLKNSQYWETDWDNLSGILDYLLKKNRTSCWVQMDRGGTQVREHVKDFTLDYFFDSAEKELVKDCHLLNAARIIVRNDKFGREFIDDYLNYCSIDDLVAFSPNVNNDSKFKWSCGDQDVLNCLIYRYILDGKIPPLFPKFSFFYRIFRIENRNFDWRIGDQIVKHRTGIYRIWNLKLLIFRFKSIIFKL